MIMRFEQIMSLNQRNPTSQRLTHLSLLLNLILNAQVLRVRRIENLALDSQVRVHVRVLAHHFRSTDQQVQRTTLVGLIREDHRFVFTFPSKELHLMACLVLLQGNLLCLWGSPGFRCGLHR